MMKIFFLVAVSCCGGLGEFDPILDKHEANYRRIHSLRITFEGRRSDDGGKNWLPMFAFQVCRSGRDERAHVKRFGSSVAGEWKVEDSLGDVAFSEKETRLLSGFDPAKPPRVPSEGLDVSLIKGNINSPTPVGPHGRTTLWTSLLLLVPDGCYSLRELIEGAKNRSLIRVGSNWKCEASAPDGKFH